MKKVFFLNFIICFAFLAVVIFAFYLYKQKYTFTSPLPWFMTVTDNPEVNSLNLWLPFLSTPEIKTKIKPPVITGIAALSYDLSTGKTLFSKNPYKKLPMASLTKIMTAIIALENPKKDDKYKVYKSDLVTGDDMGLSAGEVLSLNNLMYGLVLHSGNDAAETIASNFSKGQKMFTKLMNDKAKALGLLDTNFTNPTGLQGDGDQYTTAYDMLVMTRYAMVNFPLFDRVINTFNYVIYKTPAHKSYILQNETNLLTSYPGVEGVKTGYTPEAGLCLITYLHYKGHNIIAVLLGSQNRRGEMEKILDYSLISLGIKPPAHG